MTNQILGACILGLIYGIMVLGVYISFRILKVPDLTVDGSMVLGMSTGTVFVKMGHPLGATGGILTCKLLNELTRRRGRYGLVTMCVGGGMGAAGIYEMLD